MSTKKIGMIKLLIASIISISFIQALFAQTMNLRFNHLSVADGLSNSTIQCILQDRRGYMWFGTSNGLNRYDGYQFTVYKNDPNDSHSINDSEILALLEDRQGYLWIGTRRGGLNRYDRLRDQFTYFIPDTSSEGRVTSAMVWCLFEDSEGQLWVGTSYGLYLFHQESKTFTRYQHHSSDHTSISDNVIRAIFEDRKKRLWIGTNNGLNLVNRETGKFTRYFYDPGNIGGSGYNEVRAIYEDAHGSLWIGSYFGGILQFNPEKAMFKRYSHDATKRNTISNNHVLCINGDAKNLLYIGTENGGLNIFDISKQEFSHHVLDINEENSITCNSIYSVYFSRDSILWLGTFNGGVNYSSKQTQVFRHYKVTKTGLNNPYVLSIAEDHDGNLWIGTDGGGLNFFNRSTGQFKHFQHDENDPNSLSVNEVTAVFVDSRDQIWVGTYLGGLDLLDRQTGNFTHFRHDPRDSLSIQHDFVQSIFEDSQGNLYIGLFSGMDCYHRAMQKFSRFPYPIISSGMLSMIEDHRSNLWVGTYYGLSLIDKKAFRVTNYLHDFNDKNCSVPSNINTLYEDSSGHLWLGTLKGLYRFDRETQQFIRYTLSDGLPNNNVAGIVEDRHGNLWLSAGYSILKMVDAINFPDKPNFINLGTFDGLRGLFQCQDGEIFFGGNLGLNALFPDDLIQNSFIPPIVLTNFKIFNKDVGIETADSPLQCHIAEAKEITLCHDQSVFTFEFAALNYIFPDKNQYAYFMEGFDKEWSYVGNRRSATYTNLDPGDYVFKIKGSNNDGIWNEQGASIEIKIIPPWWKTFWAYIFYILMAGALLYGVWRFQLNRVRMKHELLLEHRHAEKLEEIDRMKTRFFSNITHEFRTPLTLIMMQIKQILASDLSSNFKALGQMILRNSQNLYQLIDQLLDLSRLEAGRMPLQTRREDIDALLKDIIMLFAPLAERKEIKLQYSVLGHSAFKQEAIEVYVDRDKLEKIISNLLSNAIKFTSEGGTVQIYLRRCGIDDLNSKSFNKFKNRSDTVIHRRTNKKVTNSDLTDDSPVQNQGDIEIIIKDNGMGIPAEQIDKIFDRFYQVDEAYSYQHEGTGLGLALTKELVELHHGTIEVESEYGKGSIFTVRLPSGKDHLSKNEIMAEAAILKSDDNAATSILKDSQSELEITSTTRSNRHSRKKLPLVLIVEDNAELRKYLCDHLNPSYQILEASDGAEGIAKAIEQIPDLIISDVIMPMIDGFELCKKIKTDQRTSHIPIILLTARTTGESKIAGLKIGADDYITKPFEMKELQARIRNLIEQRLRLKQRFNRQAGLKPEEIATSSGDEKFLQKALDIIEKNMSKPDFGVEKFAREIALSRVQLYRKILALTGQSTGEFIRVVRLNRAAQLLKQNHDSVTQIAYSVGFNSSSYFSRSFYKQFGVPPSDYAGQFS